MYNIFYLLGLKIEKFFEKIIQPENERLVKLLLHNLMNIKKATKYFAAFPMILYNICDFNECFLLSVQQFLQ